MSSLGSCLALLSFTLLHSICIVEDNREYDRLHVPPSRIVPEPREMRRQSHRAIPNGLWELDLERLCCPVFHVVCTLT